MIVYWKMAMSWKLGWKIGIQAKTGIAGESTTSISHSSTDEEVREWGMEDLFEKYVAGDVYI